MDNLNIAETVPVTLDRERRLYITFGAIRRAENVCGVQLLGKPPVGSGAAVFHGFLYAALLTDDPKLMPAQVDDMIDQAMQAHKYDELQHKFVEAFTKHYRIEVPEEGAEEEPKNAVSAENPGVGS
jgi:hypothetical protein